MAHELSRHNVMTHASAIAFRLLVSLVPLVLLGLAVLGALGLEDVWTKSLAPRVEERVTSPVFTAIDFSVARVFDSGSAGVIVFASLLLLWELSRGVRAIMVALNVIHDVEEDRSALRLLGTTLALAVAIGVMLVASALIMTVLPRLGSGLVEAGLTVVAWTVAVVLLGLVIGLLVRYAPAERPSVGWASAGSVLVVATWVVASLLFGWWAGSVADYTTAVGTLVVVLVLTGYLLVSSAIFLVGAELDELAQKESRR